jgi:hypothetical protein
VAFLTVSRTVRMGPRCPRSSRDSSSLFVPSGL